MKTILLLTALAAFVADYRRFKAESVIRASAGESLFEKRKHRKQQ